MVGVVAMAEELVHKVMGQWDSSHDPFHAFRVRDLALSLAKEEALPPNSLQIVCTSVCVCVFFFPPSLLLLPHKVVCWRSISEDS